MSWLFLLVCSMPSSTPLQNVQHARTIEIHHKKTFGRRLKGFFVGLDEMKTMPVSLCRIDDRRIGVTDSQNGRVVITDHDGRILKIIKRTGRKAPLGSPVGICADRQARIFVSDSEYRGILCFNKKLKFIREWLPVTAARFTGLACDGSRVFAVDTQNHRVVVIDENGSLAFKFGQRGGADGMFNFPTHIAVDAERIYVNDAMNFRIQIFDQRGTFVGKFGGPGNSGGQFSKPKGLGVSASGFIFVSDVIFDNVQIFNDQGRLLSFFGDSGSQPGQLWMPSGLFAVKNEVWVADTYNRRIQVFRVVP